MHGKRRTGTVTVTEGAAQAALRRGNAQALASAEEKVLRMRLGAALPLSERLERLPLAGDAEIEVLAYEIEAWLRMKERSRPAATATAAPARVATTSRTKEKIVRALRRKR